MPQRSPNFPPLASDWLIRPSDERVLALGRSASSVLDQAAPGRLVVAVDDQPEGVRQLLKHAPRALPICANLSRLPLSPGHFDAIIINQTFHTLDPEVDLRALASLLRPNGALAVSYTIRDDAVPWVRRLISRLREIDPEAMTGQYGAASVAALDSSPLFVDLERRSFRLWAPMSHDGLLAMVDRRFPHLDAPTRATLLADVSALYHDAAKPPEPLMLPYRVVCWRAVIDPDYVVSPRQRPDDALPITL